MQSLLIFAFLILICGLTFLVFKWPQGVHVTFSGHAATTKKSIIYYNIFLTTVMLFLLAFFLTWFVPTFHLSLWFSVCIVTSCIFEYFATLIPEVGGWKTRFHRAVTLVSVLFLLPVMAFIIVTNTIGLAGRVTAMISLLIMIGIISIVAVRKNKQRYHLLLQIGYYAAFFVTILVATYFNQ